MYSSSSMFFIELGNLLIPYAINIKIYNIPYPEFAHKKHMHEFQILNIIRVFSYSTIHIAYRIF